MSDALPLTSLPSSLKQRWQNISLSRQFALSGGIVMVVGMVLIGFWVTGQIVDGVTKNAAAATARYTDSFIAPLAQELEKQDVLSIGPITALDQLLSDGPLGKRIVSVKIWKKDGLIAYSRHRKMIGKSFPPSKHLKAAWKGAIVASFDNLDNEENALERASGLPLIEIYAPVRAPWSGEVIAVAEFYENATDLQASLARVRLKSWFAVALTTLAMAGLMMGIVHRGSRTIDEQREALQSQLQDSRKTSQQNQQLRLRVQRASARNAELNEQYLKRISADLHDGPAQLLSLAALRIGSLKKHKNDNDRDDEIEVIRSALDDAMTDIRNICHGLSLPDIEEQNLEQIVENLIAAHQRRTQTSVTINAGKNNPLLSPSIKICVYRFIQEGLNNALQHAEGKGQKVSWRFNPDTNVLTVDVIDQGPGLPDASSINKAGLSRSGLGLQGLRERIESIGGALEINSRKGEGTQLTMRVFTGVTNT